MLSVYTVNSTANTGPGSLRDAIAQANANQGADEIAFAPELSGGTVELSGSQLVVSGALVIDATSLPDGVTIDGNLSTRLMYINSGASVELRGLTFTGGRAPGAEGTVVNYGILIVDSCTFIDNDDEPIWNDGSVTISRSFFRHNMGSHAAGVYNQGNATIIDSTFAENGRGATFKPPVIATVGSSGNSLTIERSTIGGDENPYDPDGQGISIYDRTFFGPITQFTPRVVINNSVVFGNVDTPVQANYSLLADVDPALVAGVGYLLNADPQLGPLANNGGPTPTYAVLPSSPVLDAGDPSFVAIMDQTDQRGAPYHRLVGRLDMGAYEAQATPVGVPADFNADGRAGAADYIIWRKSLGTTVSPLAAGDATGDGLVDDADYGTWRAHFGFVPLGGKLVVNDLGDRDDGNISNGRLTLREAINFQKTVTWADSITFDPSLSGGVIQVGMQGPGYYQIEKKLTIDARMLPDGITLDAGGRTVGLHINAFTVSTPNDFEVTLAGLTITGGVGGFGGGGAINSLTNGKLTVIDCQLLNSNSGNSGVSGAIYARGDLEVVDSIIDGAVALSSPTGSSGIGTAVFAEGNVTLVGSTIRNVGDATHRNTGVFATNRPTTPRSTVTLIDSEITATTGGGVTVQGHVHMERSRIENTQGPGVFAPLLPTGSNSVASNVTLIDSTVSNNTSNFGIPFQGKVAGNGIVAGGDVVLTRSRVENNRVSMDRDVQGGGITANGHVTATDSFINGNNAEIGGGIYARGMDDQGAPTPGEVVVTLVGSAVNNNESQRGGAAVHSFGSVSIGTSSLSGNKLLGTFSTADPNGIVFLEVFASGHTLNIADSVLAGNSALSDGRTAVTNSRASANIEITRSQVLDNEMNGVLATRVVDSTISRNAGTGVVGSGILILGSTVSDNHGGGLVGSDLHIRDSTIRENIAVGGGAGAFATGSIVVERSLIAGNETNYTFVGLASQTSGGLSAPTVVLVDSTVRDNSVSGPEARGAGINTVVAYVYGSTISGNAAIGEGARGGGVFVSQANRFRQSTVSGNRAEGAGAQGGGIWVSNFDAMQVTVVDNQATGDLAEGGGVYTGSASRLVGGVLANNTATFGAPDLRATSVDPGATLPGVAYSLVRDPNGSPLATGGGAGNLLGVDPLLGLLAYNGGRTETHAPLPGSPLIDAGDPTLTAVPFSAATPFPPPINIAGIYDQRGEPYDRVVDGGSGTLRIDIGAVEVQSPLGTASLIDIGVAVSAPVTPVASRTSTSVAADAALAEMADDDLLLLIATDSLVAAKSQEVDPVLRTPRDRGSVHEDQFAIAPLAKSLSALRTLNGRFTTNRMI